MTISLDYVRSPFQRSNSQNYVSLSIELSPGTRSIEVPLELCVSWIPGVQMFGYHYIVAQVHWILQVACVLGQCNVVSVQCW
jgi:hypothetical protein